MLVLVSHAADGAVMHLKLEMDILHEWFRDVPALRNDGDHWNECLDPQSDSRSSAPGLP